MPNRMEEIARPNDEHPWVFENYDNDPSVQRNMVDFLSCIWSGTARRSFCFLASSRPDGTGWQEYVVRADKIGLDVSSFLIRRSRWDFNLYFCPNTFSRPIRKKEYALPTSVGWCDMDSSDPGSYVPAPSLVWETSPRRYQALWLWAKSYRPQDAEQLAKKLAYRHGGDTGWSITKVLRIPDQSTTSPNMTSLLLGSCVKAGRASSRAPVSPRNTGQFFGPWRASIPSLTLQKRSSHATVVSCI